MLVKEYRICMPLTVKEYQVGQLYMISKHSNLESRGGEGVQVIANEPLYDPQHGQGQFTAKNIYLSSKLPHWFHVFIPRIFYIREKAWNYYPYTITEYTCPFMPTFSVKIETQFEDNNGSNSNVFNRVATPSEDICYIDIVSDMYPEHSYKESEDPRTFRSEKTGRGPLTDGWRETCNPIMCSYKLVEVRSQVYGLQSRVEQIIQRNIRDILLMGHREAFAWIDEWIDMTVEDVRRYERDSQRETNQKVSSAGLPGTEVTRGPQSEKPNLFRSGSVRDELLTTPRGGETEPAPERRGASSKERSHSQQ